VGAEKFSDFLAAHKDFHVNDEPTSPPVHTPTSLSVQHIESQIHSNKGELHIEKLCSDPRVFLLRNFITDDEATHLMSIALPKLDKALVVEPGHVDQTTTKSRTNSAAWLKRSSDPVVLTIENRIGFVTGTRTEQGEDLQVLHYDVGQEFTPHHDYFDPLIYPKSLSANGGHRMATLLIYLQSALAGGQTSFPRARLNITAQAGDAILFFDLLDNGEPDPMSQHAGLPVASGEKWIATKWIHVDDFSEPAPHAVTPELEQARS
jgi:prolyl 4-hydroxylase